MRFVIRAQVERLRGWGAWGLFRIHVLDECGRVADEKEAGRGAQTIEGATLHLRAMIAALEVFAAGDGVPVRVLFYRC